MDYSENSYIVLDCAPGCMRPDNVLEIMLRDTTLKINDFENTVRRFGEWHFHVKNNKLDEYYKYYDIIVTAIINAETRGLIRYGAYSSDGLKN
jgi:hypothetical protein